MLKIEAPPIEWIIDPRLCDFYLAQLIHNHGLTPEFQRLRLTACASPHLVAVISDTRQIVGCCHTVRNTGLGVWVAVDCMDMMPLILRAISRSRATYTASNLTATITSR